MPELPEVETIRLGLKTKIIGLSIRTVEVYEPSMLSSEAGVIEEVLIDSTVVGIRRRGKVLLIDLDNCMTILIHLKMTGQLIYRSELDSSLPNRVTRFVFTFRGGRKLYFNDRRKFGYLKLVRTKEAEKVSFLASLGPEPLSKDFTLVYLTRLAKRYPNTKLKTLLLDQTKIAGIGNIYADEVLWESRLCPTCTAGSLTGAQLRIFYQAIGSVLRKSLRFGGTSSSSYVRIDGTKGGYAPYLAVYRRTGKTCSRCGTLIVRIKVAGRSTHYCPHCQSMK